MSLKPEFKLKTFYEIVNIAMTVEEAHRAYLQHVSEVITKFMGDLEVDIERRVYMALNVNREGGRPTRPACATQIPESEVRRLLSRYNGVVLHAARSAKVSESHLRKKIKEYSIDLKEYRPV